MWRALVRRRAVVFTCVAVAVAFALLHALLAMREYRATATVHIERKTPEILTFEDVVSVDPAAYIDFHETQYKLLQSRAVMGLAADRMDLEHRPELAARKGSPLDRAAAWLRSVVSGPDPDNNSRRRAMRFLSDGIEINPMWSTQLVEVSFVDRDPALAREVANAMADAYLRYTFESRYGTTAQAAEFLTKEVARLQTEIADMERKLQAYGTSREILELGDGGDISQQALSDISRRHTEARGRLAIAEARFRAVRDARPESLPEVLDSPLISDLRKDYAELDGRYSQMAERFKPDWPPLIQLSEELGNSRRRLEIESQTIARHVREVSRNDYDKARTEAHRFGAMLDQEKQQFHRINNDSIEYASLKAEIDSRRRVVDQLMTRQSETTLSDRLRETATSNVRVVDRAEMPTSPVRPRRKLNLALALVLGAVLGFSGALLLEHLDNTVKTDQEIQDLTGLPILAHVPFVQPLRAVSGNDARDGTDGGATPTGLLQDKEGYSPTAEAFKTLRTSVLLAAPEEPPRQIVVTSAEPGAGKTTVSFNLALVLSQLGRRVVLIDADLRRPRIHRLLGVDNDKGLSNLLSGNATIHEVIRGTERSGLKVITSGPIPPNPSELIGSPVFASALETLRTEYHVDHVVIDSSPLLSVTDTRILVSRIGVSILIARSGQTVRDSLTAAAERLREGRSRILGAVVNAVSASSGGYYYGSYHHEYGADGPADTGDVAWRDFTVRRFRKRAARR